MQLFWNIAKSAVITGVIFGAIGAIVSLLSIIPFPAVIDFSSVSLYFNKVYTIFLHWIPGFSILWPIAVAILRAIVAYWLLRGSLIAVRFVLVLLGGD